MALLRKVKFGICADVHVDIMHDIEERMEAFLRVCHKENVDFIIQLGDFCYPDSDRKYICKEENAPQNIRDAVNHKSYADKDKIIKLYKNFEKPSYHVIGNHDCDLCSKRQVLDYYGCAYGPYYSFDAGGFHFVVLDNNNYILNGKEYSYENGNYFNESYRKEKPFPYIPNEQLRWLEKDLAETKNPTILFSHYPIELFSHYTVSDEVLNNLAKLKKVIERAPHGVYMSMYGHEHVDDIFRVGNLWHYAINSMSNYWVGTSFSCENRYTAEIDEKYPDIRYVVPYKDSIFAIVTMDDEGAFVKGRKSEFVGKTPEELGVYSKKGSGWTMHERPILSSPNIIDRYIPFFKK